MSYGPPPPGPPGTFFPPPPPQRRRGLAIAIVLGALGLVTAMVAAAVIVLVVLAQDDDSYDEFLDGVEADRTEFSPSAPPAPPSPDSRSEAPTNAPAERDAEALERNALYTVGVMGAAGCATGSQVSLGDTAGVRAYYRSVAPCLDRAWRQTLKGSGLGFRAAGLEVFSGPAPSSCGTGVQYSFYCPDTGTIYMYADEITAPWNQYAGDDFSHGLTRLAALHTLAHEYGHHVQQVTGIFPAMGPNWSGTEIERRSELQASCLGNVWLAAQRDAYPIDPVYTEPEWESLWRFITRVPNHGSENNQDRWTDTGFSSARPGSCNTWTAGANAVR